jgi:hypothetical protein
MNFGNMNPMAQTSGSSTNPFAPGGGGVIGSNAPTTVTGENNQQTPTTNTFGQTQEQGNRTINELQNYYGEGVGSLLFQYLQSGAGYNGALTQQAVDAQTNAMQQQIQLGANNLTSSLASQGINGTGETGALTNYYNQATTQENAITSQEYYNMWNESQNREESMLGQVAQVNATGTANQSNWMDDISSILGMGSSAVGTIGDIEQL